MLDAFTSNKRSRMERPHKLTCNDDFQNTRERSLEVGVQMKLRREDAHGPIVQQDLNELREGRSNSLSLSRA